MFYSLVLSPILSYLVYNFVQGYKITYWQYLGGFDSWIDFGVLWFVAALLGFTLMYVLYRVLAKRYYQPRPIPFPSMGTIIAFAVGIGIISYWVRIIFPVGWVWKPLGFQLGHFPQYIVLFLTGLVASESNWINRSDYRLGKQMGVIAAVLVFVGFPAFFAVQKLANFPMDYFTVGGHWPSLWYAVWEQLTGFCIITALLSVGKHSWNHSSAFLSQLSRSAFAVYIFHPLVLIALSVALSQWNIEPALKVLIVAPLAVVGSFLLGWLIVQLPVVNRIV